MVDLLIMVLGLSTYTDEIFRDIVRGAIFIVILLLICTLIAIYQMFKNVWK